MSFDQIEFAVFFPLVFALFWITRKKLALQNGILLGASYFFYGYWDWRFLVLIIISSLTDFIIGPLIYKAENKKTRSLLLYLSILINLGLLAYFKYANFFIDSFNDSFRLFGSDLRLGSLRIILPVGISFYTFQTMSYSIDLYRGKMKPTRDPLQFFVYVSFFPQLVSGPIERARALIPQFKTYKVFDYRQAMNGISQLVWGLFKKMVVADNLAITVEQIFRFPSEHSGSTLFFGGLLFAFQLYADFSGYSDIAIGSARLLGIKLSKNFAFPLFSRSYLEFWRRWHISLTTWFRDYIYIPMTLKKNNLRNKVFNTFVLFFIIGIWHGASYNFVLFGIYIALNVSLEVYKPIKFNQGTIGENSIIPRTRDLSLLFINFLRLIPGFILFRSPDIQTTAVYYAGLLDLSLFSLPNIGPETWFIFFILILIDWQGRTLEHPLEWLIIKGRYFLNWMVLIALGIGLFLLRAPVKEEYIYFQF